MRPALPGIALSVLALVAACGPRSLPPSGQLVVYLNTDAPLPPAPGDTLHPGDPPPLFDTVRFDIYYPGASKPCGECSREFDVDRTLVGAGKASIGVVPAVGVTGYRARVRLYTSAWEVLGEPPEASTLDTTVALPATQAEGVTEVTAVLRVKDVGTHVGAKAPVTPDSGPPQTGLVGTWPGGATVACTKEPRADEACIPGGAYWMDQSRIVVLSPFFITRTEVTVGEFRAAGVASPEDPATDADSNACTYTSSPGMNDGLPVVCVSGPKARDYCKSVGGDLLSSAQFQYASSALVGDTYVWGEDVPSCGDPADGIPPDAEFGHSYGNAAAGGAISTGPCLIFGPVSPPGSARRDRLKLASGASEVVDLAGNASEWGFEPFNLGENGCWGTGVFYDPVCNEPSGVASLKGAITLLGGSILDGEAGMAAANRNPNLPDAAEPFIGLRCARPAR